MKEEQQVSVGSTLPSKPKRRFVVKQTKPSSDNERQTSTVEDNSAGSMGGAEVNPSGVTAPTIAQTPPPTYEDHPCWKSWRGRMSRGEYLIFILVLYPLIAVGSGLVACGIFAFIAAIGAVLSGVLGLSLMIIFWIAFPSFLVFVRMCADIKRFHDLGQSGLRYFAFRVGEVAFFAAISALVITLNGSWTLDWIVAGEPLWSLFALVCTYGLDLVVFVLLDGTQGPNKYGPDPKGRTRGASKTGELASLAQTTKRLKELGAMKASGMISESEYEARRAQILGGYDR